MNIMPDKKAIVLLLLGFFTIETLSFFTHYLSKGSAIAFVAIFILSTILSLKDLRYGLGLVMAELLIGGQGYLFSFSAGGAVLSVRMALWTAVMGVYAGSTITGILTGRRNIKKIVKDMKNGNLAIFAGLLLFAAWGAINGAINGNEYTDLFLDANGWLYLLLVFPAYDIFLKRKPGKNEKNIFLAAISWLSLKTLFVEYIFSHRIQRITKPIYTWIRDTRVGEITLMDSGFTRVFFQSHIFIITAFFLAAVLLAFGAYRKDRSLFKIYIFSLSVIISVILITFSRSFWAGASLAFLFFLVIGLKRFGWKTMAETTALLTLSTAISAGLIGGIINFPYPQPEKARLAKALNERATKISGEAAAASRFALWPELSDKIKQHPIMGQGFGTSLTYKTSDPRILSKSGDGEYTTYAFEWAWLDIWLKMGLPGLLLYVFLLAKLTFENIKNKTSLNIAAALSLIMVAGVNFFTPYLNHPLGFGILIFAFLINEFHSQAPLPPN